MVDLRNLKPGDPCPRCREPVRDLGGTNAVWCKNDCDRVPGRVEPEKTVPICLR